MERRQRLRQPEQDAPTRRDPSTGAADLAAAADAHRNGAAPLTRPLDAGGSPRAGLVLGSWVGAMLNLLAIALAEVVTVFVDTRLGVIGYAAIFALLVTQATFDAYRAGSDAVTETMSAAPRSLPRRHANFLTALALIPLIRIVSLGLPLTKFPQLTWYGLIAVPLLAATWAAARANGYRRSEIGIRFDWRPGQVAAVVAIGLTGVGLGFVEYLILKPDPLIDPITPVGLVGASAILLIGTGLTEELLFRGVLQRAIGEFLGDTASIFYGAVLFALLHIGYRSIIDVGFVFAVALFYGLFVFRTRSLIGVTISHGVTNICLFIIFPHIFHHL